MIGPLSGGRIAQACPPADANRPRLVTRANGDQGQRQPPLPIRAQMIVIEPATSLVVISSLRDCT